MKTWNLQNIKFFLVLDPFMDASSGKSRNEVCVERRYSMTQNQIAYAKAFEEARHNAETERQEEERLAQGRTKLEQTARSTAVSEQAEARQQREQNLKFGQTGLGMLGSALKGILFSTPAKTALNLLGGKEGIEGGKEIISTAASILPFIGG